MKVLVYSMAGHGFQEACQYEAALEQSALGNEVLFLYCDGSLGVCSENRRCDKLKCEICGRRFKHRINKYLGKNIRKVPLRDYITQAIEKEAEQTVFTYRNTDDLKALNYHGVDVGYGVLSSYITWTRNLNPVIGGKVKEYFDLLLKIEVKLILLLESALSDFKAEKIIFHNGRYFFFKPVYRLAQIKNIPYTCTETNYDLYQHCYREFIDNGDPFSVDVWEKFINRYWDNDDDEEYKVKTGELFFYNRRHAKYAGDKIYAKDQTEGKLPDGFNREVENIAIFNSSEDEFGAIGQEVEKYALFKSQLEGIVSIVEKYKNDKTKHFYLRVHPNLNNVPFDYHVNLYKLDYPNLTVIPGNSDISSYTLMDSADKIIVFGSTMGVESAFWKKPVICLSFALYYNLGCVYTPKSANELWQLIDTRDLPILDYRQAVKFGYDILTPKKEKFHYLNVDDSTFTFRGKTKLHPSTDRFWGSVKLGYLWYTLKTEIYRKLKFLGRYSQVPV